MDDSISVIDANTVAVHIADPTSFIPLQSDLDFNCSVQQFFVTKICAKICEKITNLLKFFTNFSLKNCENFSQNVVSNSIHYYFASKSAAFLNVHIF